MHNIDRTTDESEFNEEFMNDPEVDFLGESDFEGEGEGEYYGELDNEALEIDLTNELLSVQSEEELDQFLGNLIKKAARGVANFAKSPIGKGLIGGLKSVAKKALPIAGSALGNFLVPGAGGLIGGKLGSMASSLFEVDFEGLSDEDRDFEVARRYVKFANSAAKHAASARGLRVAPSAVVKQSLTKAAVKYAPGMLRRRKTYGPAGEPWSGGTSGKGTWVRKGSHIIL